MKDITRILVVEDQISDYELAQREIIKSVQDCVFERVEKQDDFLQALKRFRPDVILADYQLPSFTGLDALKLAQKELPATPLIIWTGSMSEDVAVSCMKSGASNYVVKENMKRLGPAVHHAIKERNLMIEHNQAQAETRTREQELRMITEDMHELICRFKPDGVLTYVNNVYCDYFGKSREELIGESFVVTAIGDFPEKLRSYFHSFSPEQPFHTFEQYDLGPDGKKRWREWMDRGIFDEKGHLIEIQATGRDITRRKEAEEKYQSIFENSPVGVFQSTPQGRFITVNSAMAQIYGYGSAQEMLKDVTNIATALYLYTADREQFTKMLHSDNVVHNFEIQNRRKDGSVFWTSISARVVRDDLGNIQYYEGFLQDVTERKHAEDALKSNERRFRALIENGLDDISLLDVDGKLLWESPSTIRNLGYQPDQFVGQDIFKIMHPNDLPWAKELFYKLIQEPGGRQHQSFRLQRSDGTWRWVEAIASNLLDEPSVGAIVVNYRDVTERKEAEEALQESEEKYRLLFENNPMPMWIYDLETLKFLRVNDAAVQHYGYSAEEFLGMTIKDIRPSEDIPRLLESIASSTHTAGKQVEESGVWRHQKKDGTRILVDIISHKVQFEERKTELVLANDVTERVQAEVEIEQRNSDLAMVAALNDVINRGQGLDAVMALITRELQAFTGGGGVTMYLLNSDNRSLEMQQYFLPPDTAKKIESLIGREIPRINVPIQKGGYFEEVLLKKQGMITSDPQQIQKWMGEFVEADAIPTVARGTIRKLIPQIFKLLNIRSTMLIPLIWEDHILGLLDISSPHIFTAADLKRMENIGGQLTTAIRRKQVEEALKEERNLLRTLIDNLPDRIYVMDSDGHKTLSNTADWKASGAKKMEDVIGKTDLDLYAPDLAEQFWRLDKAVIDSGQPVINYEESGLDEAGNQLSILTTKIPLWNEEGKVVGLVGVGRDITERKQVEARINDLLVFNEKILNNSPVGILTYKFTGECVFANQQAALILGAKIEELKKQNFHQIETWKKSGLYDFIKNTIENQSPGVADLHYVSSYGKDVWMTVDCTTFRSKDEDHVLLSISDTTERRKAEQEVVESQRKYQNLVETSHDLIWAVDAEGKITFLNRAAKDIYGYEPEELIGRSFLEIMDSGHYPGDPKSIKRDLVAGGDYQSMESYVRHRDGRQIILSANAIVNRDAAGNVIGISGSSRDITDRKRVELERQVLLEIMQGLANTNDLHEFLKLIHNAIAKVILAENFFVIFHRPETGLFEEIYTVDQYDPPAQPSMLEKSITSYVFRSGEPLLLTEEGFNKLAATGEIELVGTNSASWLGVPLKTANRNLGVMAVQDYQDVNRYTERDKNFLASIASQVALAIERKRMESAEREQRALAEALRDTAESLNSTLDYGEVLDRILAAAGRVVPHSAATIMLIEDEYAHVVRSHGYDKLGIQAEIMGIKLPLSDTANLRQMLETGKTSIIHDTHAFAGWKRMETTEWLRSNVGAPISIQGRVIGFILLDSDTVGYFTPVHAERLEAFANQAALAIHNAHLLQQVRDELAERKRAENELRISEERFRQMADNIEEVFWMTEAETGRAIYLSPAAEKVWGISPEHVLLQSEALIKVVLPEDRLVLLDAFEREKRGEKVEIEYRITRPDGSIGWVWDRAFPILNNDGKATIIAGIAADITDRKKADFETRRHLAELEALYENGLAVGQLLKPEQIGDRLIETFAHYLSWHYVTIRLVRPGTDEMELVAFNLPGLSAEENSEMENHFNKRINKIGQGLSGWAVQIGESVRTGNVHAHEQYVDTYAGMVSGLYMPLRIGNIIIGCISVESERPDAFTADDERLLATLANQAAVAFENARLYQAIQVELAERKRMEDALRTSETHYRDLADSITDILFELDNNLHYTHWNKASELFFGIPADDAIGKSMRDIMGASEQLLKREEIYKSVLREQKPKTFETESLFHDKKRSLEVSAYPSTRGVSVVAKDITERKRNEILMEKRFELMEYAGHHDLKEIMKKTVDIISEITESHIGFYCFMDTDENTLSSQVCSSETMLAFNLSQDQETHRPVDQAGVWADAARQRRAIIHNNYESQPHKRSLPDGHLPIQRELAVPIIRNEKLVALISVGNKQEDYAQEDIEIVERFADYAWDITERKQMETQLAEERIQLARRVEERTMDLSRANSNLARALRVKDEFLANMSHELRTPLNAILGLSESLGEQVAGPLNEKQQKYLTTINESGHHLLSLINDILDLAKIEAGQITLDINKVDINSVCQASLRMIRQLSQKKKQDVAFEIDSDLGLMWADERRLKQMIVNLLSNAVKFTPEGGRLGLEVHGDRTGNKVILTVWDKGIGINARDMERLFRPFVQLDSGLAREVTGTGLGLALVAQMARLHGGSVSVQSQPDEGSQFSIQLPWEPALASDAAIRLRNTGKFLAIDPNAKNKPTILLIEDTKEVVMMVRDYLEMAGYKIITAQDGIEGITQAKLGHPDLILMDIQMPRMDGFETTQKLRNDPEFRHTPIIALTALAMPDDRERCLAAGMNEYMSKPVNLKALAKMIRQFLFEHKESTS